jgi:hypothetical protein
MKCREERYLLDGIVELDDTYLGAPTHGKKCGRGTEKTKMIVALSKSESGHPMHLKMTDVPNLKGVTVGKFACRNIHQGSKIESDNARGYKKPLAQKNFHVFETYDPKISQLNWTHKVISNFKAMIAGTYHGFTQRYMRQNSATNSTVESSGIMLIYGFWLLWCSDYACGVSGG